MKSGLKNLQELTSKALGAVTGGMDLTGQRRSTNFEQRVIEGNRVYVYDEMGLLKYSYNLN